VIKLLSQAISRLTGVNDTLAELSKTHLCIECSAKAQNVKKGFTPGVEVSDAIGEEKGQRKIKENIEKEVALVDLVSPSQTKEKDPKASSLVIDNSRISDGELRLHLSFLH
jgi:hypothetical protein